MNLQEQVLHWSVHTFGEEIAVRSTQERSLRFIEEAIELVQTRGLSADEVRALVDHVYSRPAGHEPQEIGGVVVTLALLCCNSQVDMLELGWRELIRCWKNVDKIREKHLAKQAQGIAVKHEIPSR